MTKDLYTSAIQKYIVNNNNKITICIYIHIYYY
jgi:hypothetical protein